MAAAKKKPRNVRITLASDHVETVQVPDDFSLEAAFLDADEQGFIVIPTLNGGEYAFPARAIVAVVKDGSNGERPKRST